MNPAFLRGLAASEPRADEKVASPPGASPPEEERGTWSDCVARAINRSLLTEFPCAAILGLVLLTSCGKHEQEPAKGSEKGEAKAAEKSGAQTESRVSHGTN